MKFSKLDLLTLLISLFLFSSCKDSSDIGLEIKPEDAITGTLLDTVSITSRTVTDEPVTTFGLSRYPLGEMRDPIFGATTASLAAAVNIEGSGLVVGTNPVIDSVVLVLAHSAPAATRYKTAAQNREFYGDSTATYNIIVNQLNSPVSTQTTWLSNKVYTAGDQLGTFSGKLKPTTPVSVVSIIDDAADTAATEVPQIRIKLSAALIKSKILDLDSLTRSSNVRFNDAFKGLKITGTTTGSNGGIMFLDFSAANSNLEIYYKQQNATTATTIDTVLATLPIVATTGVAATVTHNYTNTPVATQLATPGDYQVTYIQAMSGLRTKLDLPSLKDLKANVGARMVINRAELVVDSSDPADSIPFKIAPRLTVYTVDAANRRTQVADNNPYDSNTGSGDIRTTNSSLFFDGYYGLKYTNSYRFNITHHIQDVIDGKIPNSSLFLGPVTPADLATPTGNLYGYANTAGRVVIGSFNNTNNRKVRLNIYYTKSAN
jgi:hypothetical protein